MNAIINVRPLLARSLVTRSVTVGTHQSCSCFVAGGQVSENVFASKWTRVTTMCHHEALGAFDSIAAIGSTSDVIDVTSFNDAFDVLCRWTFCSAYRWNTSLVLLHILTLSYRHIVQFSRMFLDKCIS